MSLIRPPIFEVHERKGKIYKIFANGDIEGFEVGAVISNGITPLINAMVEIKYSSTARHQQEALAFHGLVFHTAQHPQSFWQKLMRLVRNKW